MKKVLIGLLFVVTSTAYAKSVTPTVNYNGVYACSGKNELVGEYEVSVTLKFKRFDDVTKLGTYDYTTETENGVTYRGQAITSGTRMSMTYKLVDGHNTEFSTGLSEFKKNPKGKWTFKNLYYESDDTGGNYGEESCVFRSNPFAAVKKTSPVVKATTKKVS